MILITGTCCHLCVNIKKTCISAAIELKKLCDMIYDETHDEPQLGWKSAEKLHLLEV